MTEKQKKADQIARQILHLSRNTLLVELRFLDAALSQLTLTPAAGGVGIVFRVRAVGNHKNLDVFKQAARGPKAVALAALDLVERRTDGHAAPLKLDMYQRQTVDEDGHVVARVVAARRMAGRFLYRRSGSC